jgi:hypothetical protein
MKFKQALETISGLIDYCYEENIENYEEIEKAETVLTLLIHELEKAGIKTLKDIKSKEKEKNNETMD